MYVKIEVGEVTCHDFFSFLFLSFFFIGNWEGFFFFFFISKQHLPCLSLSWKKKNIHLVILGVNCNH